MSESDAFFLPHGNDPFVATEHGRGPWSPDHQHAGPPSALLARAIERAAGDGPAFITRLTVELLSPVPIGPLEVATSTLRAGRAARATGSQSSSLPRATPSSTRISPFIFTGRPLGSGCASMPS
jgi:hypothetical protein